MTPFDSHAIVAMLVTFYPRPLVSELQRARRERPEYFAGGILFGSAGEKLRLPDGRVWDLIYDAGGPRARWQAIDVTHAGPAADDPFPLEPGPLAPLDEAVLPPPLEPLSLANLAGELLEPLGFAYDALEHPHRALTEAAASGAEDGGTGGDLDDAEYELAMQEASIDHEGLADVIRETDAADGAIDTQSLDDDVPPQMPTLPNPPQPTSTPDTGGAYPGETGTSAG